VAKIKKDDLPGLNENLVISDSIDFYPAPVLDKRTKNQTGGKYDIYKTFIINIYYEHDRLHQAIGECDKYDLWGEPVYAIEGKFLNLESLETMNVIHPELTTRKNNKMKKNEIACYLSHVKAIMEISKLPDGCKCMIVEDDFRIREGFDVIMTDINNDLGMLNWDIIFFGCTPYDSKQMQQVSKHLYRVGLSTGTWAYMLKPESARRILQKILPVKYPIDLVLTGPYPTTMFPTNEYYDHRYDNELDKYAVHTGDFYYPRNRIGVIDELSSTVWNISTSADIIR
jgi:GR25 family glycosyltransferase involved in LPS biosynthesis